MMPSSLISRLQLSLSDFHSDARGVAPASITLAIKDLLCYKGGHLVLES